MFLNLNITTENVSVTSKARVGVIGSMLYSMIIPNLTQFKVFRYFGFVNEIVAIIQRFVTLTFTTPRNVFELNSLYCQEHMGISISCSFYAEKEVLTK